LTSYRHIRAVTCRKQQEDGLAGLVDRRLGKASLRRVPVDKLVWMLGEYRTHHLGWNVKQRHARRKPCRHQAVP
jgi:hypothetical protein